MDPIIRMAAVSPHKRQLTQPVARKPVSGLVSRGPLQEKGEPGLQFAGSVHAAVAPDTMVAQREIQQQHQRDEELAAARLDAQRKGFANGLEQARAVSSQATDEQIARLISIANVLSQTESRLLERAEDTLVAVAYTAVCRMIADIGLTHDTVAGYVGRAISECCNQGEALTIRLNPQDLELMSQVDHDGNRTAVDAPRQWRGDASVALGGCIVDSAGGTLDARLETQLTSLKEILLSARQKRVAGGAS